MKKIFKKIVFTFVVCLLLSGSVSYAATDEITVLLNGKKIIFDVKPQVLNQRTLVPMRKIFEALGANVEWVQETQTAVATKGTTKLEITLGDNHLYINGTPIELDTAAQAIDGRTLVPVRAISEGFCLNVDYEWQTKTVIIKELSLDTLLNDIYGYVVSDIWNDGFCDIDWYLGNGTDACGDELDIEEALLNLDVNVQKKVAYDAYINGLDDFYSDIKNSWNKLSSEIDNQYKTIKGMKIKAKSSKRLSTNKFLDYMDKFEKVIDGASFTAPVTSNNQDNGYTTAQSIEEALNSGKNLEGEVVEFVVRNFIPNSAFGYNLVAGEHLNFITSTHPNANVGDTVKGKIISVQSLLGSWIIFYEKLN